MLEKIEKILPVPDDPIDIDESVKLLFAKNSSVTFPDDYIEYSRKFGSGRIVVEETYTWEIYSAFRKTLPVFVEKFYNRNDVYRQHMEQQHLPLGLFPEPNGLLPFGGIDDVYFTFKTEGEPDAWNVVVIWLYEEGGFQTFEMGFTEFLFEFLSQKIQVAGFAPLWNPATDLVFISEVFGP